ncbi:MAG TPA: isoprenylcysteine carboxylmethyltransferase family protein [Bacillota bacterium]|nr:isoprenylcysteine carboxylmethyltransferase family protein [Bacillota bacterium]
MNINQNQVVRKRMAQILITLLVEMAILFGAAGTLNWLWAWVFFGINLLYIIVNGLTLPKELIAERGAKKENVKQWDRILTGITIIPFFGVFLICGLDQRFGWTGPTPFWVHDSGIILLAIGCAIFTWSMISNRFFSTEVRIQAERNHTVATAGPYKIVRHPGYVGFILQYLSIPLMLGGLWGLIPAGIIAILFIIRTSREDATLQNELTGYREYACKVKFRILPGIW